MIQLGTDTLFSFDCEGICPITIWANLNIQSFQQPISIVYTIPTD